MITIIGLLVKNILLRGNNYHDHNIGLLVKNIFMKREIIIMITIIGLLVINIFMKRK
jgi:membrane protein CcdC involved in cytochrome C biogenesis